MILASSDRIQLAFEKPLVLLKEAGTQSDYLFAISTVARKSPEYLEAHRIENRGGRYLILDNGAFEESRPVDTETLLDLAEELEADEVVAPDWLSDGDRTTQETLRFIEKLKKRGKLRDCKVQVCIQGRSVPLWLDCYNQLASRDDVDVIGLTYWKVPDDLGEVLSYFGKMDRMEQGRLFLIHKLIGERFMVNKPHHLLGLCSVLGLEWYRNYANIRSLDTSLPITVGLEEELLTHQTEKPREKLDFLRREVTSRQRYAVVSNCAMLRQLCLREYV